MFILGTRKLLLSQAGAKYDEKSIKLVSSLKVFQVCMNFCPVSLCPGEKMFSLKVKIN